MAHKVILTVWNWGAIKRELLGTVPGVDDLGGILGGERKGEYRRILRMQARNQFKFGSAKVNKASASAQLMSF